MCRLLSIFAALLALVAGNAFGQAAYVHDMSGSVTATLGTASRALKTGDVVESGTVVSTGEKSSAVLKFEDGQVMALAERSSLRIVDYRYNKARVSESSAVFNLLAGGLRFITGMIGSTNHNSIRMNAGGATIGLRGTDGSVTYDAVTQAVNAAVAAGEVAITNQQGTRVIGPGQFSRHEPGREPSDPAPIAQATAAVQQVLNSLASQSMPINTPVVIALSARAAAAAANARQLAAQAAAQPGNAGLQRAAQEAADQAQQALSTAIGAAQNAYREAIEGGAVPPAPESPPPGTDQSTGLTGTTGAGASGAGGAGGGGGSTCTPSSASPC